MPSNNDLLFILWILTCLSIILFTPGKIGKVGYSRLVAGIFICSCLATIWFHETVIDVSKTSPLHGAILAFAQVGTLTLSSKLWLSLNFKKFSKALRISISAILYGALLTITICAYWLSKIIPELLLILYPLSSLSISITAEMLENRWK
jgi:hypothetical protein